MPEREEQGGAPPRTCMLIAAVLATAFAATIAIISLASGDGDQTVRTEPDGGQLRLGAVPAPQATQPQCTSLIANVPTQLTAQGIKLERRKLAEPAPQATTAWGSGPVILRCGVERPPELTPEASLRVINGVQWLPVPDAGSTTWYLVDRDVYAALTVHGDSGTGPLQEISDSVARTLHPAPLRFG